MTIKPPIKEIIGVEDEEGLMVFRVAIPESSATLVVSTFDDHPGASLRVCVEQFGEQDFIGEVQGNNGSFTEPAGTLGEEVAEGLAAAAQLKGGRSPKTMMLRAVKELLSDIVSTRGGVWA